MSQSVVTFEGGLGAQAISASAMFALAASGEKAYADYTYFQQVPSIARTRGKKRGVSYWPWQLDCLGIPKERFREFRGDPATLESFHLISDLNPRKMNLALEGFSDEKILNEFSLIISDAGRTKRATDFMPRKDYALVHLRRGDFLNAANFITSEEDVISCLDAQTELPTDVIVASDSPVEWRTRRNFLKRFRRVVVANSSSVSPCETLELAVKASIFIGSNSQFSLLGALLSQNARYLPSPYLEAISNHAPHLSRFGINGFPAQNRPLR